MLTRTISLRRCVPFFGVVCAAALAASCDSEDDGSGVSAAAGGASGAQSNAGNLNIAGAAMPQGEGGAGAELPDVTRDDACATSTDATRALPPVVQLVIDTSGSMAWPPGWAPEGPDDSKPPGATKWEITRDVLMEAVAALPDDMALGASFYPNVAQEDELCLLNEQAAPIGVLSEPGVRDAWEVALGEVDPVGATPTHGAYLFGLQQLADSKLPGDRVVLLITDGTPTCDIECTCTEDNLPVDSQPLIDEAAAAYAIGVRTFVIGSPGSEQTRDVLSRLASEGGTAKENCSASGPVYCHFDMTTEPDLARGLSRALAQIGTSLRSCEYPIPAPPAGKALEPDLVNVLYTPSGGDTETIGRDPSASDCAEGWQYSADGQNIVLCGEACRRVRENPDSVVEVLFGCQTVVSEPK